MPEWETLTDCQAADHVRRCLDGTYLLSLEVADPGFDVPLLHDFWERKLTHHTEQQVLDTLITAFKAHGLCKAGGRQRTDATHNWVNVHTLNRIECVGETM